ncbi:T9SS type B sorting domain-containing protein [Hymenobacter psychrophilus]|uniref:Gliding motility-associated C-terminal domain-containing protein n=1 Tax=Hymenobacter psychrophilus TaxID=651662 RepID=A0A1H3P3H1_9BACT|nr:gliding motility-associated C-terminal domain-containing protein [Hymenobacter psychrophilus]SDY95570.1 gliding motility-associated C-terminal domain-containing protein [Hymenobacter psychrophilus]
MPAKLRYSALATTCTLTRPVTTPSQPARPGGRGAGGQRRAVGWLVVLLVLLLSGLAPAARAQTGPPKCSEDEKFANTWYFGFKAGLDFNMATDSIQPTVLTDGAMDAPAGAGIMSDGSGKILFYSNGETVWNGDGSVMTNGTGLNGNRLTTDGPLPIRMPGSPPPMLPNGETRYLIFTQDAKGGPKGLSYSEIIIPAGGGPGTVVAATKNTPLAQGTAEKMTGVFHKNGCDIWIIVHGWGSATSGNDNRGDAFLAYRVRPATGGMGTGPVTIDAPIASAVGSLHAPSVSPVGYRGQMRVTPDGQQLALARYSEITTDSSGTVELFSFDTGTGAVSNPQIIDANQGGYYGVAFSPGRSRLYATVLGAAPRLPQLLQFDISTIGTGTGNGPVGREVIPLNQPTPVNLGSMQTAPDGKIYVARENQPALGFISYPDSLGAAIGYADDSLQLGGSRLSSLGLVNFNQSSLLRFGFGGEPTGCLEYTFQAPPVEFDNPQYAWDFGDGTTSTAQNPPPHTYPRPGDYEVTLRITTECFCRETKSMVRIFGPPTPGTIADNQTVCAGDSVAVLTSTAPAGAGTGQYLYQWQSSPNGSTGWANVGTKSSQDTYAPGILATTTYFRRVVESGFCPPASPSNVVKITVTRKVMNTVTLATPPPLCAGTPFTFTAVADSAGATPTYQWFVNNAAVQGETNKTFTTSTLANGDRVRVDVTPTPGLCSSGVATATVTVTVTPKVTPKVTLATPAAQCAGTPLIFTASDTDAGTTPTYQWFVNNVAVQGETKKTFTSGTLRNGDQVRVQVTPTAGLCSTGSVSASVTVTVTRLVKTTVTLATPAAQCAGTPFTFTAVADSAGATPTYQWFVNNAAVQGETRPTFTSSTLRNGDQVRVDVTPTAGLCSTGLATASVTVTVTPLAQTAVTIATQPTQCAGTPLTFTATPTAAGATPTFQWFVNNVAVPNETRSTFTTSTLINGDRVRVDVTPTPGLCSTGLATASVTITVTPLAQTTVTLATPPAQCAGTPFTLTAMPDNAGEAPTYQWFVNNAAVQGETRPTFTSSTLRNGDRVRVDVTPTAGLCSTGLATASVTITVTPLVTPTVTLTPPPAQCPGTPLTFTAVVTNAGPAPTFRWFVNNIPVASGPTFTSSTVVTGDQVRVEVTATAGQCSTGPATATVTVTRTPTPTPTLVVTGPSGPPVCPGEPQTFSATSVTAAGPNPVYQWQVDGNDVAGATGPVFTSSTLRDGQTVTLRLSTANACGPVTALSNSVTVRVQPPVRISAGPDKEITLGTSVVLEGTADGNYPVTWTPATGLDFSGNDPLRPRASPKVTTTYRLSAGAGGCASFDEVTVTVREAIRIPNAFTPNGDGRDDTWQIEFIEEFPTNTVTVFNRWGNEVFSAQNYSRANEWNGTINGKPAPVGTYYYVVVTKGPLGKSYSGSLTVLY